MRSEVEILRLRDEDPETWKAIAEYHRFKLLNELWNDADKRMLAAPDEGIASRWEFSNQWIAQKIVEMSDSQVEQMTADPEGYFRRVRAESFRQARGYLAAHSTGTRS